MKRGREGGGERKEKPPLAPLPPSSGRRKRPSSFFLPLPLLRPRPPRRIMYLDPRSQPPRHLLSLAISLSLSLSLSLAAHESFWLVLRSAREARVLPVPIVSCMINDRVWTSRRHRLHIRLVSGPRWLDRSRGRRCEIRERTRRHLLPSVRFEKNRLETAITCAN